MNGFADLSSARARARERRETADLATIWVGGALLLAIMMALLRIAEYGVAHARASADEFARGFLDGCGEPCVVAGNDGGKLIDYVTLAASVLEEGRTVVIAGRCYSACALFADLARPQTCVLPTAEFLFHRASDETVPPDADDVRGWVERHGGFPSFRSGVFTRMDYVAATAFWRPCCRIGDARCVDGG